MEIEHVAGERLAPRRAPEQQRNFTVGLGVLGKIIIKRDGVALVVTEVFSHGTRGVRRDVLKRSRLRGRRRHHNGVVHRACVGQGFHYLRDRRALLRNGAVNANDVPALLIDDGVEDDGGLSGLAVAYDQLALAASDGNHRVNSLNAGLQWLANGLAVEYARCDALQQIALLRRDGALPVHQLAQRIDHAANQFLAYGDGHNRVRALNNVALFQLLRFAEKHHANLILFEVQRDAENVVRKGEHLAGHDLLKAINARDAVADADDRSDFVDRNSLFVVLNLLPQNLADFVRFDIRHACSVASALVSVASEL